MIDVVARALAKINKENIQNLAMGSLVIANDSITDDKLINTGIKQVVMDNTNAINNKIQTTIFTATVNNTTNIVHGFTNYDKLHDTLQCIDTYYGSNLTNSNYTENANNLSIDLTSWSLNIGEQISFSLFKNVK